MSGWVRRVISLTITTSTGSYFWLVWHDHLDMLSFTLFRPSIISDKRALKPSTYLSPMEAHLLARDPLYDTFRFPLDLDLMFGVGVLSAFERSMLGGGELRSNLQSPASDSGGVIVLAWPYNLVANDLQKNTTKHIIVWWSAVSKMWVLVIVFLQ